MKRLFALLLLAFAVCCLTACGGDDDGLKDGATIVTYTSWSLDTKAKNNLERRMIAKFNKDRDDIQIKIVEYDGSDYDQYLTTLASGRQLPDVFMSKNVADSAIKYLAANITDIAAADEEWATISPELRNSISYGANKDQIYGVPAGQYYNGLFANYSLINGYLEAGQKANKVFAPGAFTTDQFVEIVKKMKKINVTDNTGVIGLNSTGDMINWLPSVLDKTGATGHFCWNDTTQKFDYRSEYMYAAYDIISDLGSLTGEYTLDAVANNPARSAEGSTLAKPDEIFANTGASELFRLGGLGFYQSGTYATFDVDFAYSFVAYPDATVISVSDYYCISYASKHKEASYEVAKYMSFGYEGTMARFDIIDNAEAGANLTITTLPLVNNAEIAERWFEYMTLPGAKQVYDKVVKGEIRLLVEGNKYVPGFQDARFNHNTGLGFEGVKGGSKLPITEFIWAVAIGQISPADYRTSMTAKLESDLNAYVTNAQAALDTVIAKHQASQSKPAQ